MTPAKQTWPYLRSRIQSLGPPLSRVSVRLDSFPPPQPRVAGHLLFPEEILHQGFEQLEDMGRPSEIPYKYTPNKVRGLNTNTQP